MSDIEAPIISLSQEDPVERDANQEKFVLSKKAIIIIFILTILGITLILTTWIGLKHLSQTIRALITVLGVILSTPILFLFFKLYHYFITPLYPSVEDNENEMETTMV